MQRKKKKKKKIKQQSASKRVKSNLHPSPPGLSRFIAGDAWKSAWPQLVERQNFSPFNSLFHSKPFWEMLINMDFWLKCINGHHPACSSSYKRSGKRKTKHAGSQQLSLDGRSQVGLGFHLPGHHQPYMGSNRQIFAPGCIYFCPHVFASGSFSIISKMMDEMTFTFKRWAFSYLFIKTPFPVMYCQLPGAFQTQSWLPGWERARTRAGKSMGRQTLAVTASRALEHLWAGVLETGAERK